MSTRVAASAAVKTGLSVRHRSDDEVLTVPDAAGISNGMSFVGSYIGENQENYGYLATTSLRSSSVSTLPPLIKRARTLWPSARFYFGAAFGTARENLSVMKWTSNGLTWA
jgi:hypothetical protein